MKKLILFLGVLVVLLALCSSKRSSIILNSDLSAPTLVKKIQSTDENGDVTNLAFVYKGNKILSEFEGNTTLRYTYKGNNIIKIEQFDKYGKLVLIKLYSYANGKVESLYETSPDDDFAYKTIYTYKANGIVSYSYLTINVTTNKKEGECNGTLVYQNGNLIGYIKNSIGFISTTTAATFEYDKKKNPRKNILGYSLLLDKEQKGSINNVIKSTTTYDYGTKYYEKDSFSENYTYDRSGYPISSKCTRDAETIQQTEHYY